MKELSLQQFQSIGLEEMDRVRLMNRIDTKFAIPYIHIQEILNELSTDYFILEINGIRLLSYKSLYFDDDKKACYHDHHNGKMNRYKVRIRKYEDSNQYFVEIKHKFKGRTDKKREGINEFETKLPEFVTKQIPLEKLDYTTLKPILWNSFQRITLINKQKAERLTLDFCVQFESTEQNQAISLSQLVIAELKQEKLDRSSLFFQLMKKRHISPHRISKYCIGICLLHPTEIKTNRFKSKLLKLQKLNAHVA